MARFQYAICISPATVRRRSVRFNERAPSDRVHHKRAKKKKFKNENDIPHTGPLPSVCRVKHKTPNVSENNFAFTPERNSVRLGGYLRAFMRTEVKVGGTTFITRARDCVYTIVTNAAHFPSRTGGNASCIQFPKLIAAVPGHDTMSRTTGLAPCRRRTKSIKSRIVDETARETSNSPPEITPCPAGCFAVVYSEKKVQVVTKYVGGYFVLDDGRRTSVFVEGLIIIVKRIYRA